MNEIKRLSKKQLGNVNMKIRTTVNALRVSYDEDTDEISFEKDG